jgi:alpha-methylacyl-CoA racemase
MAAMILADLGAEVVRIERKLAPGAKPASELFDPDRHPQPQPPRRHPRPQEARRPRRRAPLIAAADGLIEGYRPGVMERLGLGPTTASPPTRASSMAA